MNCRYSVRGYIEIKVSWCEMDLTILVFLLIGLVQSNSCYSLESEDVSKIPLRQNAKPDNANNRFNFYVQHPQLVNQPPYPLPPRSDDIRKKGTVDSDSESHLLEQAKYDSLRRVDVPRSWRHHHQTAKPRSRQPWISHSQDDVPQTSNEKNREPLKERTLKKPSKKRVLDPSLFKKGDEEDSEHHIFFHVGPSDKDTRHLGIISPETKLQEDIQEQKPRGKLHHGLPKVHRHFKPTQKIKLIQEDWRIQNEQTQPKLKPQKFTVASEEDPSEWRSLSEWTQPKNKLQKFTAAAEVDPSEWRSLSEWTQPKQKPLKFAADAEEDPSEWKSRTEWTQPKKKPLKFTATAEEEDAPEWKSQSEWIQPKQKPLKFTATAEEGPSEWRSRTEWTQPKKKPLKFTAASEEEDAPEWKSRSEWTQPKRKPLKFTKASEEEEVSQWRSQSEWTQPKKKPMKFSTVTEEVSEWTQPKIKPLKFTTAAEEEDVEWRSQNEWLQPKKKPSKFRAASEEITVWRGQDEWTQTKKKPLKFTTAPEEEEEDKKDLHVASVNSNPVIRNFSPAGRMPEGRQEEISEPNFQSTLDALKKAVADRRGPGLFGSNDYEPESDPDSGAFRDNDSDEPKTVTVEDMNFGKDNREQFHEQGRRGESSYKFGYNTGDSNNPMARYEERDADGVVRGSYSFVDANGKMQVVHYESHPEHGFRTKGSLGYHAGGF